MRLPAVTNSPSPTARRISLNRPDSLNSWNEQFGDELAVALDRRPSTTRFAR